MASPTTRASLVTVSVASRFAWIVVVAACADTTDTPGDARSDTATTLTSSAPRSESSETPAPPPRPGCDERIERARARGPAWIDTRYDSARAEILGRARGEPVVFVREPAAPPIAPTEALRRLRGKPHELRAALLREGYLFAETAADARALTTEVTLTSLFDEPTIHLQRGSVVNELARRLVRGVASYVHADGRTAELLFGDRVAVTREELATPLHRDVAALAEEEGFLRVRPLTRADGELVAEVDLGGERALALLSGQGARVEVACVAEAHAARARDAKSASAGRRAALAKLRAAVELAVREELPFDRPIGEKTAEKDGQRRPLWEDAYRRGAEWFAAEGGTYPVFDARGEPHPPEVCMEFIVDSFERATGTWYRPRSDAARGRVTGALDFDALGLKNRRGVLGFEAWARAAPELFDVRRFAGEERVPFGRYGEFVRGILALETIAPGDVVAIHGRKRDGLVHQHGILVLRIDPVTGFPYDLADQMRRARRRTWDGIMAEAPLRSLLYRARPTARVLVE